MLSLNVIRFLGIVCLGAICIEGCPKKKVDGTEELKSTLLRSELTTCMETQFAAAKAGAAIDFFVLHTRWFAASLACKTTDSEDDKACWLDKLKECIPVNTVIYDKLALCINNFAKQFPTGGSKTTTFNSEKIERKQRKKRDVTKMISCPTFSVADFVTSVGTTKAASPPTLEPDDTTIDAVEDLANFMINYVVCPAATCTIFIENLGAASLTGMKTDQTGCANCWYTKIVGMLESTSAVNAVFSTVVYEKLYLASHIVCLPSQKIYISPADVTSMGIQADDKLYLGKHRICSENFDGAPDDTCNGAEVDLGGGKKGYDFTGSATCGAETSTLAGGKIQYQFQVTKVPKIDEAHVASRHTCAVYVFDCEVNTKQLMHLKDAVTPEAVLTTMTPVAGTSAFEFSFVMDKATVKIGEVATGTIKLTNVVDDNDYILSFKTCYATPESDSTTIKYDLIDCNGCPVKGAADTADDMTKVVTNKAKEISFSFTGFKWAVYGTRQVLFLHCEIEVCQNSLTSGGPCDTTENTCTNPPACPAGRARAMRFRRAMADKRNLVTFGPISVVSPLKTLSLNSEMQNN